MGIVGKRYGGGCRFYIDTWKKFLLSPNQFFIPNSRLRYYLLAKRKPLQFIDPSKNGTLQRLVPGVEMNGNVEEEEKDASTTWRLIETRAEQCHPISDYLQDMDEETMGKFLLPDKLAIKYGFTMGKFFFPSLFLTC